MASGCQPNSPAACAPLLVPRQEDGDAERKGHHGRVEHEPVGEHHRGERGCDRGRRGGDGARRRRCAPRGTGGPPPRGWRAMRVRVTPTRARRRRSRPEPSTRRCRADGWRRPCRRVGDRRAVTRSSRPRAGARLFVAHTAPLIPSSESPNGADIRGQASTTSTRATPTATAIPMASRRRPAPCPFIVRRASWTEMLPESGRLRGDGPTSACRHDPRRARLVPVQGRRGPGHLRRQGREPAPAPVELLPGPAQPAAPHRPDGGHRRDRSSGSRCATRSRRSCSSTASSSSTGPASTSGCATTRATRSSPSPSTTSGRGRW